MLRSRGKSVRNSNHIRNRVLETYSHTFFPLGLILIGYRTQLRFSSFKLKRLWQRNKRKNMVIFIKALDTKDKAMQKFNNNTNDMGHLSSNSSVFHHYSIQKHNMYWRRSISCLILEHFQRLPGTDFLPWQLFLCFFGAYLLPQGKQQRPLQSRKQGQSSWWIDVQWSTNSRMLTVLENFAPYILKLIFPQW